MSLHTIMHKNLTNLVLVIPEKYVAFSIVKYLRTTVVQTYHTQT